MRTFILFAMLCSLLQGCVGGVVLKTRTKVINDPLIPFYSEIPNPVSRQNSSDATNTVVYTSEWLKMYWGSPDLVSYDSKNSEETWTYRSRRVWEGVVPFVIVPIPLALPVGREKVCLTLRDGRVVSASTTKSCTVGGTYGFIPNPNGGGGFGAWSWDDASSE
jgi:hypothetical protein